MRVLIASCAMALSLVASLTAPVMAQSSRSGATPESIAPKTAAEFSKQIERALASRDARVALVFRTGRPQADLPEGIRFTHGAFWVYQDIVTDDGESRKGYAVYNLYAGGDAGGPNDRSALVQDFPYDFTAPMAEAKAGVIVLTPEMQRRVLNLMASSTYAALHQPNYSLVSNPHDLKYQNCNEFYLDVIASAAWETDDRTQIKVNLAEYFEPAEVKTNVFQRVFGPMVNDMVETDDHSGGVRTATFLSIARFLETYKLSESAFELSYDPFGGVEGLAIVSPLQ